MTTRSITLTPDPPAPLDAEPARAWRRFAAIVRTLAPPTTPPMSPAPATGDAEPGPTRRLNRIRRLLGTLPKPGKSRQHARRRT